MRTISIQALSREAFAPFGDVITSEGAKHFDINAGTVHRYHRLASVDVGHMDGAQAIISIARIGQVSTLPYQIKVMERHPLGSQAFIPLSASPTIVVVAPDRNDQPDLDRLCAFITNGHQGFNYRPGVWHMPLISQEQGQELLIVDRHGPGNNCDEVQITEPLSITL